MMGRCVTHVDNNQSLGCDGSVQNVPIMTYVLCVTTVTNITCVIDSSALTLQAV